MKTKARKMQGVRRDRLRDDLARELRQVELAGAAVHQGFMFPGLMADRIQGLRRAIETLYQVTNAIMGEESGSGEESAMVDEG